MPIESNYIHGTDPGEQNRLKQLNELTNQSFIQFLTIGGHEDVLELGSGLGILTASVARYLYKGHITGIEISKEQLSKTPSFPANMEFILGDIQDLPFENDSFDLVYGRYILEHVSDPFKVLREAYRILRKDGRICLQENSSLWMEFYPHVPAFTYAWKKFIQLQTVLGGDGMIGIKLYDRLKKTGFKHLQISLAPESHCADDATFKPWIENLIGNLSSGKDQLLNKNLLTLEEYTTAIEEMESFKENPLASSYFAWNRIEGRK